MKKQFKTRLVLNSQTIRRLPVPALRDVQGARAETQTCDDCPPSVLFCRGCG